MPPKNEDQETSLQPGSLTQRLASLEIGESESKVRRIECDQATKDTLMSTITALRNGVASCVKRASDLTGHRYVVESGDIRTKSYDFLMVVTITRLA